MKMIKRIMAYLLDLMIVSLVATCLSQISFLNPKFPQYKENYDIYAKELENYETFLAKFQESYKDEEITLEELEILKVKNVISLEEYYQDEEISKEEYEEIYDKVYKEYKNKYQNYNYDLSKLNYLSNVYLIICIVLYFAFFQFYTNGQTLGKKIFKLQVQTPDGNNPKFVKYLIRSLILTNGLITILNTVLLFILSKKFYLNISTYILLLTPILEYVIFFTALLRKDKRGLHDLIANTKVVDLKQESIEKD